MKCDPSKGPGGIIQVNGCVAILSVYVRGRRGGGKGGGSEGRTDWWVQRKG